MPKFSPDGTRIAFTSDVPRDSRNDEDSKRIVAEEKARKYKMRAYDRFPIRNWDTWLPENRQPHAFVQTLGQNDARDLFAGTEMIKQPGFDGRSTQSASELDLTWTPDGQSLIFSATRNANRGAYDYTNAELWQVAAGRRRAAPPDRRRTISKAATAGASRDSARTVAACMRCKEVRGKHVFSRRRTWRRSIGRRCKERPSISLPAERDPMNFVIAPNNRDIYLLAEDAGHVKIYRGKSSGGEAKLAFEMSAGVYAQSGRRGSRQQAGADRELRQRGRARPKSCASICSAAAIRH